MVDDRGSCLVLGRRVSYRWFGADATSGGPVVVYAHGGLSCAADGEVAHQAAYARGIRVLAINRPGIAGVDSSA